MPQARADRPFQDRQSPAFWRWSLTRYRRPGVESLLLGLQDEFGLNVNVLLWAAWCAEHFETAPELSFRNALDGIDAWQARVTKPLRGVRRSLKSQSDIEGAEALRAQVKAAELDAEKIEQAMLERTARAMLAPAASRMRNDVQKRARRNFATYAALAKAPRQKGFSTSLLQSLIDRIFDAAPSETEADAPRAEHDDE